MPCTRPGAMLSKRTDYRNLIRLLLLALMAVLASPPLQATEPDDPEWRNFQHALGEPALIGANAGHTLANTAYRPIPAFTEDDIDEDRFRLGFHLFHEGRLSSGNAIACITCHAGPASGVDGRRVSLGVNNIRGHMNALTTFNAAFNFRQFWDGRSVTLEDQALEPILSELEMANTREAVLHTLQSDALYPQRFANIYPDGVTINNMLDALAHFQRINFTRSNSPFLRHLAGEDEQLSEQALRGWQVFDGIGCASCHNGINLGGNSYQQLGAAVPYYTRHREPGPHDEGVRGRSQREHDIHVFKVPGLHNVASTAPYFHDGSVPTLEAAITLMAEHQLGRELRGQEISDIAAFLRSLSSRFSPMPVDISGRDDTADADAGDSQGAASQEHEPDSASHHEAYLAAIGAVETAQTDLLSEIQRIHSGDVAHFDFLQFQHLELIRHARALHHPPSALDEQERSQLVSRAEQLLHTVNEMEWTIADFLRAQAMVGVFTAHMDVPGQGEFTAQLGDIPASLAHYREEARQSMVEISRQLNIISSFSTVLPE